MGVFLAEQSTNYEIYTGGHINIQQFIQLVLLQQSKSLRSPDTKDGVKFIIFITDIR